VAIVVHAFLVQRKSARGRSFRFELRGDLPDATELQGVERALSGSGPQGEAQRRVLSIVALEADTLDFGKRRNDDP